MPPEKSEGGGFQPLRLDTPIVLLVEDLRIAAGSSAGQRLKPQWSSCTMARLKPCPTKIPKASRGFGTRSY